MPRVRRLALQELQAVLACPRCRGVLTLRSGRPAVCQNCAASYAHVGGTCDLTVPDNHTGTPWAVWLQLQSNGLASYTHDPEHNLSVGPREDCRAFGRFCRFDGMVLDVGCGPQPWPTYFDACAPRTRLVGIDPLIESGGRDFCQLRALAEDLPFRDNVFDHVVFATSLDHVLSPVRALREAARVSGSAGVIDLWFREQTLARPRRHSSPEWYRALVKPAGAEDVFHLEKLTAARVADLIERAGLRVITSQTSLVDEGRRDVFIQLRATPR